jgi:hypothetical protein
MHICRVIPQELLADALFYLFEALKSIANIRRPCLFQLVAPLILKNPVVPKKTVAKLN